MKIDEIRVISGRFIVLVINEVRHRIAVEAWAEKKFKKGDELAETDFDFIVNESLKWLARDYILRQLGISQKSKFELKSKTKIKILNWLKENKIEFETDRLEELIDIELNKLEEKKIIDDNQYVASFINKSKKKSNRQIEYELKNKGISEDVVRQALAERENSEEEVIRNLISKKLKNNNKLSFGERGKLIASLIRRGFPIDKVKCLIDEMIKKK